MLARRRGWARPSPGWSASHSIRPSARWTAERCRSRRSASSPRVASGVSRRAAATARTTGGWRHESAIGIELVDGARAGGRTPRPLRPRFADSALMTPVELAAERPRDLARLELEERCAGADATQERPDGLGALPGDDAAPRRSRHAAGRSIIASRRASSGASSLGTTNSRWVRPPARLSDPWDRNVPRSQADRQCSAAASQSNGPRIGASARRWASLAMTGSRSGRLRARPMTSATRSHGRAGSIAASSARRATTRSRSGRATARGRAAECAPAAVDAVRGPIRRSWPRGAAFAHPPRDRRAG